MIMYIDILIPNYLILARDMYECMIVCLRPSTLLVVVGCPISHMEWAQKFNRRAAADKNCCILALRNSRPVDGKSCMWRLPGCCSMRHAIVL